MKARFFCSGSVDQSGWWKWIWVLLVIVFKIQELFCVGIVVGTKIHTSRSNFKKTTTVEKLRVGQKIISFDFKKSAFIDAEIVQISKEKVSDYVEIVVGNNEFSESICVASDEAFYLPVQRDFCEAKKLEQGGYLLQYPLQKVGIIKVIFHAGEEKEVVKITVSKGNDNFCVGELEVVVHNAEIYDEIVIMKSEGKQMMIATSTAINFKNDESLKAAREFRNDALSKSINSFFRANPDVLNKMPNDSAIICKAACDYSRDIPKFSSMITQVLKHHGELFTAKKWHVQNRILELRESGARRFGSNDGFFNNWNFQRDDYAWGFVNNSWKNFGNNFSISTSMTVVTNPRMLPPPEYEFVEVNPPPLEKNKDFNNKLKAYFEEKLPKKIGNKRKKFRDNHGCVWEKFWVEGGSWGWYVNPPKENQKKSFCVDEDGNNMSSRSGRTMSADMKYLNSTRYFVNSHYGNSKEWLRLNSPELYEFNFKKYEEEYLKLPRPQWAPRDNFLFRAADALFGGSFYYFDEYGLEWVCDANDQWRANGILLNPDLSVKHFSSSSLYIENVDDLNRKIRANQGEYIPSTGFCLRGRPSAQGPETIFVWPKENYCQRPDRMIEVFVSKHPYDEEEDRYALLYDRESPFYKEHLFWIFDFGLQRWNIFNKKGTLVATGDEKNCNIKKLNGEDFDAFSIDYRKVVVLPKKVVWTGRNGSTWNYDFNCRDVQTIKAKNAKGELILDAEVSQNQVIFANPKIASEIFDLPIFYGKDQSVLENDGSYPLFNFSHMVFEKQKMPLSGEEFILSGVGKVFLDIGNRLWFLEKISENPINYMWHVFNDQGIEVARLGGIFFEKNWVSETELSQAEVQRFKNFFAMRKCEWAKYLPPKDFGCFKPIEYFFGVDKDKNHWIKIPEWSEFFKNWQAFSADGNKILQFDDHDVPQIQGVDLKRSEEFLGEMFTKKVEKQIKEFTQEIEQMTGREFLDQIYQIHNSELGKILLDGDFTLAKDKVVNKKALSAEDLEEQDKAKKLIFDKLLPTLMMGKNFKFLDEKLIDQNSKNQKLLDDILPIESLSQEKILASMKNMAILEAITSIARLILQKQVGSILGDLVLEQGLKMASGPQPPENNSSISDKLKRIKNLMQPLIEKVIRDLWPAICRLCSVIKHCMVRVYHFVRSLSPALKKALPVLKDVWKFGVQCWFAVKIVFEILKAFGCEKKLLEIGVAIKKWRVLAVPASYIYESAAGINLQLNKIEKTSNQTPLELAEINKQMAEMNKQMAEKDKQIEKEKEEKMILLAEKDKQIEKEKEEKAEMNKQMAEKDKQIEKEKEEKAEMNKQINSLLLIAEVFGKNAEKEMKGV